MSGVIDKNGVQWERCNNCGGFERLDRLAYEAAPVGSKMHEWRDSEKLDLCVACNFARRNRARFDERYGIGCTKSCCA